MKYNARRDDKRMQLGETVDWANDIAINDDGSALVFRPDWYYPRVMVQDYPTIDEAVDAAIELYRKG